MNLHENIHRIQEMMGVITENKNIKIINELGLYDAIRYFGGYGKIMDLIGDYEFSNEEKIDFIRDVIRHLSEKYNTTGISTRQLDMTPIFYGMSDDGEVLQIEYFKPNYVTVDVHSNGFYNSHRSMFTEKYEYLDEDILDNVFIFMIDATEKQNE